MSAFHLTGGCYCGEIRFEVDQKPIMKGQCHCRACTHISGGGPNYFMVIPPEGFRYTKGAPGRFTRTDIENARTREFCQTCGTPLVTIRPGTNFVVIKAGTLDEPALYGAPRVAIHTAEKQPYQQIPEGLPAFEALPPAAG